MNISIVRDVKCPVRGTEKSAGIDFFVPRDFNGGKIYTLHPGKDVLIPSGIVANVPKNCMLMSADKSGVATTLYAAKKAGRTPKKEALKSNIIVGAKIVDEDYQGEIHIHIINVGNRVVTIKPDFKIAQFIVVPVVYEDVNVVDKKELFENVTERGDKGIGLGTGND